MERAIAPSTLIPDLTNHTIDDGNLVLRRVLGRGTYGVVYYAETTNNPAGLPPLQYAVKAIVNITSSSRQQKAIRRELNLHKSASLLNEGVLKLYDIIETPSLIFIITEFCRYGSLADAIRSGKFFGQDPLIKHVFTQILDAVEGCHDINVFHRDLKPENILMRGKGASAVIADFGFATTERYTSELRMGSQPFMSPEVHGGLKGRRKFYSPPQADIWALGIILMNLACGCLPWYQATLQDPNFANFASNDSEFLLRNFPISLELNDLLKRVFDMDPLQRPSFAELRIAVQEVERFSTLTAMDRILEGEDFESGVDEQVELAMMHLDADMDVDRRDRVSFDSDDDGDLRVVEMDLSGLPTIPYTTPHANRPVQIRVTAPGRSSSRTDSEVYGIPTPPNLSLVQGVRVQRGTPVHGRSGAWVSDWNYFREADAREEVLAPWRNSLRHVILTGGVVLDGTPGRTASLTTSSRKDSVKKVDRLGRRKTTGSRLQSVIKKFKSGFGGRLLGR